MLLLLRITNIGHLMAKHFGSSGLFAWSAFRTTRAQMPSARHNAIALPWSNRATPQMQPWGQNPERSGHLRTPCGLARRALAMRQHYSSRPDRRVRKLWQTRADRTANANKTIRSTWVASRHAVKAVA